MRKSLFQNPKTAMYFVLFVVFAVTFVIDEGTQGLADRSGSERFVESPGELPPEQLAAMSEAPPENFVTENSPAPDLESFYGPAEGFATDPSGFDPTPQWQEPFNPSPDSFREEDPEREALAERLGVS